MVDCRSSAIVGFLNLGIRFGLSFAVIPLLQITSQPFPLPVVFSVDDVQNALLVNIVFVISFRVGSSVFLRSSNVFDIGSSRREYRRLVILSVMLWFVAATFGVATVGVSWVLTTRVAAGVAFSELGSSASIVAITGSIQVVLAWGVVLGIQAAKRYRDVRLNVLVGSMLV